MATYNIIGLMSGSSLDGIDIIYCNINNENGGWSYRIIEKDCVKYDGKWKLRLQNLVRQNAITYIKTHTFYGHYIGKVVKEFIDKHHIEKDLDFIASHGQTIFHQPENMLTSQIGDGAAIATETGFPVICDFRTHDVALGGQGTPIAPIGDKLLFKDYSHCLNLGGISNISYKLQNGNILGYDICAVNLMLNKLAEAEGRDYDADGKMAEGGTINNELLEELNSNWYFEKEYPKSLSGGWVSKVMMPIVDKYSYSTEDKLRTVTEHIAQQISNEIKKIYLMENSDMHPEDKMLITGGGAHNKFLQKRIAALSPIPVHIPDDGTVDYKEALIIALMGALRVEKEENVLSNVTGSSQNTIGGAIYQGTKKFI